MMQNLLDNPNDVGMLSLGLRLLSTPGKFGQALGTAGLGAMGDMQQAKQSQALARQRLLAEETQRMQLEQIKRQQAEQQAQRERQTAIEGAYRGALESPAQQALAGGGGPTVGNAQAMQAMAPKFNQQKLIEQLMAVDPVLAAQMLTPKPADYKVVGDSLVSIGGDGVKEAYRAPAKPKEINYNDLVIPGPDGKPMLNQLALEAKRAIARDGRSSMSVSYGAPVAGIGQDGRPLFFQPSKDGGPPAIIPGVAPPKQEEKALTEGQAKALTFASRMLASENVLSDLSQKGVNVSVPGSRSGFGVGAAINAMSNPEQQRLDQAKRDFINATLRRESGAVIADSEFDNADKQYFPQVGDAKPVIEQKARNRRAAIEGVRADVPASKQADVDRIAGQGGPVKITGDADYKALPSGAMFIGPDGKTRRKP